MISEGSILDRFIGKAATDARISISHTGLLATLTFMARQQGHEHYLVAFGSAVMEAAKISSTATYHKLIRELSEYGYICYQPSYNKRKASTIYL